MACLQSPVECDRTWQQVHCQNGVNLVVKLTVSCYPNMYAGFRIILPSFHPGSDRRMVKVPVVLEGLARVALVHSRASIMEHAWYWRFLLSSVLSSADVGSSPLAW